MYSSRELGDGPGTAAQPSPLSAEAPVQNYHGFQNLVMLLLFANKLRLVIENLLKYGLLVVACEDALDWADAQRARPQFVSVSR